MAGETSKRAAPDFARLFQVVKAPVTIAKRHPGTDMMWPLLRLFRRQSDGFFQIDKVDILYEAE